MLGGVATESPTVPARLPRLGYIPALDGLRALAVLAVLLYHGDVGWIPGGFLGVDVFFVLSGYLITCLILSDWKDRGRIDFKRFYIRRARRLLPALFVMLAAVSLYSILFLPDVVADLRGQVIAAVLYVENWHLIFRDTSYFVQVGRPPLLRHLWSLAVEEQFYLIWPLILGVGLKYWGRGRDRAKLLGATLGGALLSTIVAAVLFAPFSDPSRIYFATDTRASTMLIGACLAYVWSPWRISGDAGRNAGTVLDVMGVVGLVGVVWFFLNVGELDSFLYRGGFLVMAVFSALLIASVVHPRSRIVPAIFSVEVMRWIGIRSYGIYLWHWPVFMVTRPHADIPLTGIPLLVLRCAITFGLAWASYKWVEEPIRHGGFGNWLARFRTSTGTTRRQMSRTFVAVGGACAFLLVVIVVGLAAGEAPGALPGVPTEAQVVLEPSTTTLPGSITLPTTPGQPVLAAGQVTAIGDSVMQGSVETLAATLGPTRTLVDAAQNRQFSAGVDTLVQYRNEGRLGDQVVVHLGTNGSVDPSELDRMMTALAGVKRVVIVNAKVPDRSWEGQVNEVLAGAARRYKNVKLVDWFSAGYAHPEWFWDDGIHLRPEGAAEYSRLIAAQLLPDPLAPTSTTTTTTAPAGSTTTTRATKRTDAAGATTTTAKP